MRITPLALAVLFLATPARPLPASAAPQHGVATTLRELERSAAPHEGSLEPSPRPLVSAEPADAKKRTKRLRRLDVRATDVAYAAAADELLATVAADSQLYPSSLVAVKPKNGQVLFSVPLSADPRRLALADDGVTAYVLADDDTVQRVDLAARRVVSQFKFVLPNISDPLRTVAVGVEPGRPGTVAVSATFANHTGNAGTAIFDDGVMRPRYLTNFVAGQFLFVAGSLWVNPGAWDGSVSHVVELVETADGLALPDDPYGAYIGAFALGYYDGRFYSNTGQIVDATSRRQVGWIPHGDWRFNLAQAVDPVTNTIYFASDGYFQAILGFDIATERLVSFYSGDKFGQRGLVTKLVYCGGSGFAALEAFGGPSGPIVFYPPAVFKKVAPYERPRAVAENGNVRTIALPHNAIVYDDVHRKLIATVANGNPGIGGGIVEIDPYAGTVGRDVWSGSEPAVEAISADRQFLYVAMWGSLQVKRYRLPGLEFDGIFDLLSRSDVPLAQALTNAKRILPLPGEPRSFAILQNTYPWDQEQTSEGIAVYDDGLRRPDATDEVYGPRADSVELSEDGKTIYGLNDTSTLFEFTQFDVTPRGVAVRHIFPYVGGTFFDVLHCADGECVTDAGIVIDAALGARKAIIPYNGFGESSFAVALDTKHGRIYQAVTSPDTGTIFAYDANTLALVGSLTLPPGLFAADLLTWDDGRQLAFSTGHEILLIPTALLQNR